MTAAIASSWCPSTDGSTGCLACTNKRDFRNDQTATTFVDGCIERTSRGAIDRKIGSIPCRLERLHHLPDPWHGGHIAGLDPRLLRSAQESERRLGSHRHHAAPQHLCRQNMVTATRD